MREVTIPEPVDCDEQKYMELMDQFNALDHRTEPMEVLETVDAELKEFGLEVVTTDRGDDNYWFRVKKRVDR